MRLYFILILSLILKAGLAQNKSLAGRYSASNDANIWMTDSTLEFRMFYGCCILNEIYGYGAYQVKKNKITVNTVLPTNGKGSTFRIINQLNALNALSVRVKIDNELTNEHVSIVIIDRDNDKTISFSRADTELVHFDSLPVEQSDKMILEIIVPLYLSYFEIPLKEITGNFIEVNMQPYEIICDKTVIFKLSSDTNLTKLTGPFFKATYKDKVNRSIRLIWYKIKMIFTTWPWRWRFRPHRAHPKEFVKKNTLHPSACGEQ